MESAVSWATGGLTAGTRETQTETRQLSVKGRVPAAAASGCVSDFAARVAVARVLSIILSHSCVSPAAEEAARVWARVPGLRPMYGRRVLDY